MLQNACPSHSLDLKILNRSLCKLAIAGAVSICVRAVSTGAVSAAVAGAWLCTNDLGCSLNGACVSGRCHCDSGWVGESCELLDLLPADLTHGYNHLNGDNGSTSSWGATQLRDPDSGVYHTYVGEIKGSCGINGFETNEQIVHAVSRSPVGPWKRQGPLAPFGASAVCPHGGASRRRSGVWLDRCMLYSWHG